jgi:Ca-activated chloride channel family protein
MCQRLKNPFFGIEQKAMKIIFASFFLVLLIHPIQLHAQKTTDPAKIQGTNKTLISVPVTVSDRAGHYISGLKKQDFSIFDDGIKQNVDFFATYDEPLNIALLLDTSGSTTESLKKIKDAARDFIALLNPSDQCLLATFDSQIKILSSFTSDQPSLINSLQKVQTAERDGTILHNAIEQISQKSFAGIEGRKVIVLLSDGRDFGSSITGNNLLSQLEESDVLIYSILYRTGETFNNLVISPEGFVQKTAEKKESVKKKPKKKKVYSIWVPATVGAPTDEEADIRQRKADIAAVNILRELSDTTAGRFYLSDAVQLRAIFKRVAAELRQQYRLGYHSKNAANDATTHDITVKVERAGAVVRTRGKFRAKQL